MKIKKIFFRTGLILSFLAIYLAIFSPLGTLSLFNWRGNGLVQAAEDCTKIFCSSGASDYLECNRGKQSCWEEKINETQSQAVTLTNTINLLNGQISLQQLQVDQTLAEISQLEGEVEELVGRIKGLGFSLDRLSTVLIERVRTQYKQSRSTAPILSLLASNNFSELITRTKYLLLAQRQTVEAMEKTETQRFEYDEQKNLKQEKQLELEVKKKKLEAQEIALRQQKTDQQYLLNETKNNEAQYQFELAKTLAELSAIQSIIAGKGNESKVKEVNEGDKIASIITGASTCSTGSHLHFEVVKDSAHRDPASYLSPVSISWNNSPDGPFGFSGNWRWPMDNAAKINQGYGMTYYARVKRSYGGAPHTGIDMASKTFGDYDVKAVKKGTLYRGSIGCGGGLLRYVRVEHADGSESSYYLHVNY